MLDGHRYDDNGLLAREIGPWSRDKAHDAFSYANLVSVAIHGKRPIWWLDPFAGPGRLWEREAKEFLPGSSLEALDVDRPFTGYSFADINPEITSALRTRIGDRPDV